MGIKLSFEYDQSLGPDDKELLTGLSIMTLAIANHELAKEHLPGVFYGLEDYGDVQTTRSRTVPAAPLQGHQQARRQSGISEGWSPRRHRSGAASIDTGYVLGRAAPIGWRNQLMTKQDEPARRQAPTTPPSSPPPANDAEDGDEEIARILEYAKRRGREEPGSIIILVPSKSESARSTIDADATGVTHPERTRDSAR